MVRCVIGWKQILQAGFIVFLLSGGVAQAQDVRGLLVKMTVNVLTQKGFSRSAKLVNAVKLSLEKLSLDPYLSTDGMIALSQQQAAMLATDREFLNLLNPATEPAAEDLSLPVRTSVTPLVMPPTFAVQAEVPVRSQHLMQTVDQLAHRTVSGYGPFFAKINRSMFSDRYGMDLHQMIALHETLYPQDKGVVSPRSLEPVFRVEKRAMEMVSNGTLSDNWQKLSDTDRMVIFESFLPTYLLNPGEEAKEISVPLLAQALQYYREIVSGKMASKTREADRFAQQMSAVTNLSLFGRMEDVPLLLEAAQQDFGLFNEWADYFLARAVFNLGTYKDVRTLAYIRLKMARERGELMPPVWQGIRELGRAEGQTLRVPLEEIETKEISVPPFLQENLLLHHAFNYLLANPTQEVTLEWKELRAGLVESFQPWLTAADDLANVMEATVKAPAVKPAENPAEPVEPFRAEDPAEENPPVTVEFEHQPQRVSPPIPREHPVKPAYRTSAPKEENSSKRTKSVEKRSPVRSEVSYKKPPLSDMAVQEVMTALEDYVWEHQAAPDFNSELRHQVNRLRPQAAAGDPVCQQIVDLMDSYNSNAVFRNSQQLYNELQRYIQRYGKLPPRGTRLRNRINRIWQKNKATDTWSQSIIALVDEYIPRHFISSAELLTDLKEHLAKTGGLVPEKGTLLHTRISNARSKYSNDPNVQEIDRLFKQYNKPVDPARLRREIEQYLKEHGEFLAGSRRLHSQIALVRQWNPEDPDLQAIDELVRQANQAKYDNLLFELEAYVQEHEALPPQHSSLRSRLDYIRKAGDPANETVQQILTLTHQFLQKPGVQVPRRRANHTPQQIEEELEAYLNKYGEMPAHGTPLRNSVDNLLNYHKGDEQDAHINHIRELKEQYRKKTKHMGRTPQSVLEELQVYVAENEGKLPPQNSGLRTMAYQFVRAGSPDDPAIKELAAFLKEHAQRQRRTTQEVYEDLRDYVLTYGKLPPAGHPLRQSARRFIRKQIGDPEIRQAIKELLDRGKQALISQ